MGERRRRLGVRLGPQDDEQSIAAIQHALEHGIDWIDTVAAHGCLRTVVEGPAGALHALTSSRDARGRARRGDDRILHRAAAALTT